MGEFRDHPAKRLIREQWCKPLIKHVHDYLRYKLLYLGLPGREALDLDNWIEYFDEIIAFQCRDYGKPSSILQNKRSVTDLHIKLREYEQKKLINTYSLYDGYIEEVILRGKDITGSRFSQNDVVTVYNLDFCNSITSPIEVIDENGPAQYYYKTEVIRRLLELQREISNPVKSKKFIMFFTVHSNFILQEGRRYLTQTQDPELRHYLSRLRGLGGRERNVRLLKAYITHIIKEFYCHCDFTPEFLPAIYYRGVGIDNWLIHNTIIGTTNKQISARAPHFQNMANILNRCFLTPRDGKFDNLVIRYFKEEECGVNSVDNFRESECYKQLWK